MAVRIASITQPLVTKEDGTPLTAEEFIVYCARVSNPNNQLNTETGVGLIKYCLAHGHWSIFEQAYLSVEIKTSRAIAAQLLRHRSFTFQEFSQRYSEVSKIVPIELRKQAEKNRQSSTEIIDDPALLDKVNKHFESSLALYNELIENLVAKECARGVMPLNTETTLYMCGSVRSWIHYIDLRQKPDTQKEHRVGVTEDIRNVFIDHFPQISEARGYVKT